MSGLFTLLKVDSGGGSDETKTRVPNIAVKITRGYRLSFGCDEMFARYVISLSKFKLEEQFCFAVKLNIMHIRTLQNDLIQ